MVHVVVPVHSPPHPVKVEPLVGVAVSVTMVAVAKTPVHSVPQLKMPELGLLLTCPVPVPVTIPFTVGFTVTVNSGGSFQLVAGV